MGGGRRGSWASARELAGGAGTRAGLLYRCLPGFRRSQLVGDSHGQRSGKYASAVRAAIKDVDPHLLVTEMQPVDALVDKAQAGTRFSLLLIGVFAVIAGVLAGVGLYAVLATAVRQRTAEIGVRMALGAQPAKIFRLVVGQGFRLSAIGIAAGLIAAFLLTRLMRAMLVGVQATDPVTFGMVAIAFLLIAAVASWVPALRAAALDPVRALREE